MAHRFTNRLAGATALLAAVSCIASPNPWLASSRAESADAPAPQAKPPAAESKEWTRFHGPQRDNVSSETGLLKRWPEGGPPLAWSFAECGRGYAMVSIAGGRIYTAGDFGDEERILALSLDGKWAWQTPNGKSWKGPYPGSRTTPAFDQGVLYHLNPTGLLAAIQADTGKLIWSLDLKIEFGARYGTWAMAENVVVEGDRVYCVPGGGKGLVAALDKRTGKTVWANTELDETAAYCSPIVATHAGVRQLITVTQKSVIGVEMASGKLLWSHPHPTKHDQNVNAPIFLDGHVFVSAGHSTGGTLLRLGPDSRGVATVWARSELDNCHSGVVLLAGHLYGSACRLGGKAFFCAEVLTGKITQTDRGMGRVSLTAADGMLYGLHERGRMLLIAATPGGFSVASQFQIPRGGDGMCLSQPVVCGGRLYVRHGSHLFVYDVRAR
jgi:outer membrane protein assembly factor BamB